MSIILKSLSLTTDGRFRDASKSRAMGEVFNQITKPNVVMLLYQAPAATAAVINNIRIVNTHSADVTFSLYFNRPDSTGNFRRRLLLPANIKLPPNFVLYDDLELFLDTGDTLEAQASVGNVIHCFISGFERGIA